MTGNLEAYLACNQVMLLQTDTVVPCLPYNTLHASTNWFISTHMLSIY